MAVAAALSLPHPAEAQELGSCPGPQFYCLGPGGGDPVPGGPPDPLFRRIKPPIAEGVDLNRSYILIEDGKAVRRHGAVELRPAMREFIERRRTDIDLNHIYSLSPESFESPSLTGQMVIIGGGALGQ